MLIVDFGRDESGPDRSGKDPNHFRFHIFIRKRNKIGKGRSGKRNLLFGISETVQFDRKDIDNGRKPVLKSGNTNACNHFKHPTQCNMIQPQKKYYRQIASQI